MKKNDIVGYTKDYLDQFKDAKKEDRFIVIEPEIVKELILIKDVNDKSEFTKKYINKYWIYVIEEAKNE